MAGHADLTMAPARAYHLCRNRVTRHHAERGAKGEMAVYTDVSADDLAHWGEALSESDALEAFAPA